MVYTIYKVTNLKNGKVYIGFDSKWPNRKTVHKSAHKNGETKFYRALKKYGWESFDWQPIYQSNDKTYTLNIMENFFIREYDSFNNGYNSTLGGDGGLGIKHTQETKNKISEGNRIPKPQTPEHVKKRTESRLKNIQLGITSPPKISEETKLKISKSTKGIPKPMSEQHKKNLKCHSNNTTKIKCPHCDKIGQLTNMKRWHFNNCKSIPEARVVGAKQS
jgi:group I intron endonuclease